MNTSASDYPKHILKILLRPGYRARWSAFRRLRELPPFTPAATDLLGQRLDLVDGRSFEATFHEIFEKEIYRFETAKAEPLIIDGGANIGLSVIYFKRLYPRSRIIAFEPDPAIFAVLKNNCMNFGLNDVELVDKALWTSDTTLKFRREGGEGGRIAGKLDGTNLIEVHTRRLKDYLEVQPVELLKLDIEGAETEVLRDCKNQLSNVRFLFVEYHSFAGSSQTLHELTSILHAAGFRLHMQILEPSHQPFINRKINSGMDLQANIFGYREHDGT